MAFIDRIRACNGWDPAGFVPFRVGGVSVGRVRHALARRLTGHSDVFVRDPSGISLHPGLTGLDRRTAAVAEVLGELEREGLVPPPHGELFPVGAERRRPELLVDRAAAVCLGVRGYGQHVNGFVQRDGGLWIWVGRRSSTKRNCPGRLDHIAAGGVPHGIGLAANLLKECREEADIPARLARQARPVGLVTYCRETGMGLRPDTLYCYDLALPADFRPRCNDGEMDGFQLLPVKQVSEIVRDTDEFKWNCNLVIIDFLVRHGRLGPEREDYPDIVLGLRAPLP